VVNRRRGWISYVVQADARLVLGNLVRVLRTDGTIRHETARTFGDRFVFVEKSVDDGRSAAARYGVRGTPTFVLIDADGKEIGRFGFRATAAAFAQTIEAALARVRGS